MKVKRKGSNINKQQKPPKKLNPFEMHINHSKHQVLGRRLKSDYGLPGVSKSKALQKRKKTLLLEYKLKDKVNNFIDQRIGERNSEMTEDDRIMARFAAERMRMFNKKAKFNLSDVEVLTHRGQMLSEIERYEDPRSDDEDNDAGENGSLKRKFVEDVHFGGGMFTKSNKDRESIIDELIIESKRRKAERQHNKEETLEATEQLDEEWKTLSMVVTSKTVNAGDNELNLQKKDDYDLVIRQLKFEPQGQQATTRLKTDDEIAKEDKEQLERLENERLKQLREMETSKYGNHRSVDDIDDSFSYITGNVDVEETIHCDRPTIEKSEDSSESSLETDDDNDGSEENEFENKNLSARGKSPEINENIFLSDSAAEETDDGECAMDDLTDLMPSLDDKNVNCGSLTNSWESKPYFDIKKNTLRSNKESMPSNCETFVDLDLSLPYILNVPDDYESFKELLQTRTSEQKNLIIDRLVKNNHPSLDSNNKKKMFLLAKYMLQLVSDGKVLWKELPNWTSNWSFIKEFNNEDCQKLLTDQISSMLEEFDSVFPSISAIKFLVWYILLFLKPQGIDVLLPLNRPAVGVACNVLYQCEPQYSNDSFTIIGFVCCYLLLQDAKSSSRVYTNAIQFLSKCINLCLSSRKNSTNHLGNNERNVAYNKKNMNYPVSSYPNSGRLNVPDSFKMCLLENRSDDFKIGELQMMHHCVVLLASFVKVYRKFPETKILFSSLQNSIQLIKTNDYPSLIEEITELQTLVQVLNSASLPPLVKVTKQPKTLRQYEPSFQAVTIGKNSKWLPAEKQEEQKLLHKYKHEMKGAIRELRRDRVFLAKVKLNEKMKNDETRMKKVKEIFGSAAAQQGELRSLKRKKC